MQNYTNVSGAQKLYVSLHNLETPTHQVSQRDHVQLSHDIVYSFTNWSLSLFLFIHEVTSSKMLLQYAYRQVPDCEYRYSDYGQA